MLLDRHFSYDTNLIRSWGVKPMMSPMERQACKRALGEAFTALMQADMCSLREIGRSSLHKEISDLADKVLELEVRVAQLVLEDK